MADWWKDQDMVQQMYEEAENGNTAAQCEIARQLMNDGRMEEAVSWYKRAAAAGEADAMFNLGLLYSQGWDGEDASPEQAFFWFKSAAQAGDSEAMYMTGRCCLNGSGTGIDVQEAAEWLKKALASGYAAAQELLFTIPGMEEERRQKLDEIRQTAGQAERFLAEEDYEMAVPLLQQAVEESSRKLGETDAFTISLMNNLAVALAGLGQYENSIPLKERVLELRGKCLPLTHPDYLTAVTNLTSDYARIGRYQSALNLSKQAYTAARETLPVTHDVTLLTLNRLAADYMNLCRHDLALEQLKQVISMIREICETDEEIPEDSRKQWHRTMRLMEICQEAVNNDDVYFGMDESRRNYAYICAELCEMFDGLPDDYRQKIDPQEYAHFKEQAGLVGCYHAHMNSGQAVETDPYTNALQMLVSLKYLMPAVAECREELDGIRCRAVVTWVQNELCAVITVYPVKSTVEHMEHPQPADFLKSLNACEEPGEKVTSLEAVDLQMKRLESGEIQISFAYGTGDVYRMIRMHYQEETNQLEGESYFMEIGKDHTEA
ncbi:MAG: SEL1-like repeat protein [Lachnospiraceae bacterium]|nr:SEL1-like repeat protein [Lachnospiraceae bacterium]